MTLPRFVHRLYAWLLGYFWVPCPRCGRDFGGHELGWYSIPTTPNTGNIICRVCSREADQIIGFNAHIQQHYLALSGINSVVRGDSDLAADHERHVDLHQRLLAAVEQPEPIQFAPPWWERLKPLPRDL